MSNKQRKAPTFKRASWRAKESEVYDEKTGRTVGRCDIGGRDVVSDAHAEMMAAAPDLLDACELAEGWIDSNRESESTGEGQQARWILETIRAAIQKARAA